MEARSEKLTGDAGFLLLREALDRTALIDRLAAQLEGPRDPRRITHRLPSLLRASVAMIAQGWGDQIDASRLHDDPVLAIAAHDRASVGAAEDALASQATLLAGLLRDGNAGPAQQAAPWIPRIVQAARRHVASTVTSRALPVGDSMVLRARPLTAGWARLGGYAHHPWFENAFDRPTAAMGLASLAQRLPPPPKPALACMNHAIPLCFRGISPGWGR